MEEGTVVAVISQIGDELLVARLEGVALLRERHARGIDDCEVIPKDVKAFYKTGVANLYTHLRCLRDFFLSDLRDFFLDPPLGLVIGVGVGVGDEGGDGGGTRM